MAFADWFLSLSIISTVSAMLCLGRAEKPCLEDKDKDKDHVLVGLSGSVIQFHSKMPLSSLVLAGYIFGTYLIVSLANLTDIKVGLGVRPT